ncbi:hypothetical protein CsSME_00043471 [Camellia sinensis var. sinensis]
MALKCATYTRPSGQAPGPDDPGRAAVGADLGCSSKYSNENFEGRRGERFHGIGLKFLNRDVAADGNVRESGDVGGGLGKSYLFCLIACPPRKRLSRSPNCSMRPTGASTLAALDNPEDRVPPAPGRTHNRIRSPR